ncbi:MAG: right-handed parallel beta-helix repeat-containing protein [Hyphomicrobiales bacterium]|nr:right-handed parallel beta-helix repeat-containing protein [Hyphomicrobiales bacterium]
MVAVVLPALAAPAIGDLIIRTRDGDVYTIPVTPQELESIEFRQGPPGTHFKADSLKSAPEAPPPAAGDGTPAPKAQTPDFEAPKAKPKAPVPGTGARRTLHTVWRIGPGKPFERPSEVARKVGDGDTVEIEGGLYEGDYVVWRQNDLTLRGVNGRPHLKAVGPIPNGKAIWVIGGDRVKVENIEFSHAAVPDRNGAGIRAEGGDLTIRDSYFHHNENGVLAGRLSQATIVIENSEFAYHDCKNRSGSAHGIYVGGIRRFALVNSHVHHTCSGHQVKTRAHRNEIRYNRLLDYDDGSASYAVDMPNCGISVVMGNLIHKGRRRENEAALSYGAEGCGNRDKGLWVVGNTMVSMARSAMLLRNHSLTPAVLANNLVVGATALSLGPVDDRGNVVVKAERFRSPGDWDFRLAPGAAAIDAGVDLPPVEGRPLVPVSEPISPLTLRPRRIVGKIDAGAFEFRAGE